MPMEADKQEIKIFNDVIKKIIKYVKGDKNFILTGNRNAFC